MSPVLALSAHVVAGLWGADTPSPSPSVLPNIDPERVTPGLLGLVFFVAFAIAAVFLYRSMSKQLGRIDFDEAADPAAGPATDGPVAPQDQSADGSERR